MDRSFGCEFDEPGGGEFGLTLEPGIWLRLFLKMLISISSCVLPGTVLSVVMPSVRFTAEFTMASALLVFSLSVFTTVVLKVSRNLRTFSFEGAGPGAGV